MFLQDQKWEFDTPMESEKAISVLHKMAILQNNGKLRKGDPAGDYVGIFIDDENKLVATYAGKKAILADVLYIYRNSENTIWIIISTPFPSALGKTSKDTIDEMKNIIVSN